MHIEKAPEQLNMKFMFSKESKKNGDMTKKDVCWLVGFVVFMLSMGGTMIASNEIVRKDSPANKFVVSILDEPKEVKDSSHILTIDLPVFFQFARTDDQGHRYINSLQYHNLINKLATDEKNLLKQNAIFEITKFDNLLVNNYLINDVDYFQTLFALKNNIPSVTLLHMIKERNFTNTLDKDLAERMYKKTENALLASDDINMIHTAMTKLHLDKDTKLKYATRLEKLISLKVKSGSKEWIKYVEAQDSPLLDIKTNYFKHKATHAYEKMLEDIYRVHRPYAIMMDSELDKLIAYKEKILEID